MDVSYKILSEAITLLIERETRKYLDDIITDLKKADLSDDEIMDFLWQKHIDKKRLWANIKNIA